MREVRARALGRDALRRMLVQLRGSRPARGGPRTAIGPLRRDLSELHTHIERSKADIAALVAETTPASAGVRVSGATEELYEIVASTERATSEILNAAERIQEIAGGLQAESADRGTLEALCMEIFTTCSFQDITGQRVAKVVATLAYIEQRVSAMVSIWDDSGAAAVAMGCRTGIAASKPRSPEQIFIPDIEEAGLLNGPQMPGQGLEQTAVDALFN
jgi:chemotaxis regulatin CheY-phosphate phosphatase CheZ